MAEDVKIGITDKVIIFGCDWNGRHRGLWNDFASRMDLSVWSKQLWQFCYSAKSEGESERESKKWIVSVFAVVSVLLVLIFSER